MTGVNVRPVDADAVRPLRQTVLRPGFPLEESVYAQDDLPGTLHLGALDGDEVVGVATVFFEPREGLAAWRVRGMAVAESHRRAGIGSALLSEVLAEVRRRGGDLLWCNARTAALPFYTRHGFTIVGEEFLAAHGVPHLLATLNLAERTPG